MGKSEKSEIARLRQRHIRAADDSGLSNQIAKEQTTNRIRLFFPRPVGFGQVDLSQREERDRETDVSAAAKDHLSGPLPSVNAPDRVFSECLRLIVASPKQPGSEAQYGGSGRSQRTGDPGRGSNESGT